MAQTLFWYDIETFGLHPRWDRIAQFAGIRTDEKFAALEEPLVLYCQIPKDYLPNPHSCLVTGITPQETLEKGLTEYEFIQRIHQEFSRPGTCVAGFNSVNFDDEFIRNTLYRNFFDPYRREYANGNSRWDIIDLLRAARDLRPQGMVWPKGEEEKPSFRLEKLAAANGIDHQEKHDALGDVKATIALAKKFHEAQPKLFHHGYSIRQKEKVQRYIDLFEKTPFIYTSRLFTSPQGCTTLAAPLAVDPKNRNCILAFDLRSSPEDLISLSMEEVKRRIFTPNIEMSQEERIPIVKIYINRCPFIAPMKTLDKSAAERLKLNVEQCREHARHLKKATGITQKVLKVFDFSEPSDLPESKDPDLQIYSGGFFPDDDREGFEKIHKTPPNKLRWLRQTFEDGRVPEMLWRFRGRNFPETLAETERKRWRSFCAGRILFPPLGEALDMGKYRKIIEALSGDKNLPPRDKVLLKSLDDYGNRVKKEILEYHE